MKKSTQVVEKFFDILGEILAVLTLALYVVLIINANWEFIHPGKLLDTLLYIKDYAALIVVAIVGFEAVVKLGFVMKIVYLAVLALIIIAMFFPGTLDNLKQVL